MADWNPRYLSYCRAHGHPDPDEMLAVDKERWPGGAMTGFSLWVQRAWLEFTNYWNITRNAKFDVKFMGIVYHKEFDHWLTDHFEKQPPEEQHGK
jgi:hypothetical protein